MPAGKKAGGQKKSEKKAVRKKAVKKKAAGEKAAGGAEPAPSDRKAELRAQFQSQPEVVVREHGMGGVIRPLITLITDFGEGSYAGATKGAILDICPEVNIVDITHNIKGHDVLAAAFTLLCSYRYYPAGTIHVVVVDPGVGSDRRGLAIRAGDHYFVGPDNGVFSFIYNREPEFKVVSLDSRRYFRRQVAPTFHGRDVFGPVAAWLARGTSLEQLGDPVMDYSGAGITPVTKTGDNLLEGTVLHVDRFGNLTTSMTPAECCELLGRRGTPTFIINDHRITRHYRFYSEARPGELFSLVGSSGHYEVAVHRASAAERLDAMRGSPVEMEFQ